VGVAVRRLVRERANDRCEYCRLPQSSSPVLTFHVEHIIARQHLDDERDANLCLACAHCNLHKGPNVASVLRETHEIVSLFHLRQQLWEDHFLVNDGVMFGRTRIGEVTIRLLRMNDDDQLQIRKALIARGEF